MTPFAEVQETCAYLSTSRVKYRYLQEPNSGVHCTQLRKDVVSAPPHRRPSSEEVCSDLPAGNKGSAQDVLDDGRNNSAEGVPQSV